MNNCEWIKRYGSCSDFCRKYDCYCEPSAPKSTVLDHAIEYVIAAACLVGALLVILL